MPDIEKTLIKYNMMSDKTIVPFKDNMKYFLEPNKTGKTHPSRGHGCVGYSLFIIISRCVQNFICRCSKLNQRLYPKLGKAGWERSSVSRLYPILLLWVWTVFIQGVLTCHSLIPSSSNVWTRVKAIGQYKMQHCLSSIKDTIFSFFNGMVSILYFNDKCFVCGVGGFCRCGKPLDILLKLFFISYDRLLAAIQRRNDGFWYMDRFCSSQMYMKRVYKFPKFWHVSAHVGFITDFAHFSPSMNSINVWNFYPSFTELKLMWCKL